MEKKFEIKIENETFYFVIDENGYVWYLDKENGFAKVTNNIFLKAKDLEHAKSIGKDIIHTMGYTE